jgi:amino acid permease
MACRSIEGSITEAAYVAPFWPWAHILLVIVCSTALVSSIGSAFAHKEILKGTMATIGTVLVIALYVGHKLLKKTRLLTITEIGEKLIEADKKMALSDEEGVAGVPSGIGTDSESGLEGEVVSISLI